MSDNDKVHADRCRVFQGYPVESRLMSIEEIDDYFSTERIVCLRCGRSLRQLDTHLYTIHGMTADGYRALYGLPWRRGLTCPDTHRRKGAAMHRRVESGYPLLEIARVARETRKVRGFGMRQSHYQVECQRRGDNRRYGAAEFDRLLVLVAAGMTLRAATREPGMPSLGWVALWRRAHPEDSARLMALRAPGAGRAA